MVYTINIFAAFCRVYHYGKIKSLCGFFFFFFFLQKGMGLSLKVKERWVGGREGKAGERRERKREEKHSGKKINNQIP